jgi:Protein of unknown function (DUF3309)
VGSGSGHSFEHFSRRAVHPNQARLNLYEELVKHIRGWIASVSIASAVDGTHFSRGYEAEQPRREGERMLIILIILLLVFGFGGYRLGPGLGYYGGGGISLIILIVIILLLLRVI